MAEDENTTTTTTEINTATTTEKPEPTTTTPTKKPASRSAAKRQDTQEKPSAPEPANDPVLGHDTPSDPVEARGQALSDARETALKNHAAEQEVNSPN